MDDNNAPDRDAFLNQLQAIDNNGGDEPAEAPAVAPVKEVAAPVVKEAQKPEANTAPVKSGEATAASATKPEDTSKSKWAKNEERKGKTWAEINAEKAALAQEKEAIARQRQEIEAARKQPADAPYRDEYGHTAADYKAIEKQFREKGDAANADAAAALADTLGKKEQQVKAQQAQQELATGWKQNFSALAEKNPDLKDPTSELHKETVRFLKEFPAMTQQADGIKYAVQAAQLNLQSKDIDNTKAENAKLKAELDKLTKKLSIGGGSPTSPAPESKPFEELDAKAQGEELRKRAAAHDRESGLD